MYITDIDECNNKLTCDEGCTNNDGGYTCSCHGVRHLYRGRHTILVNDTLLVPNKTCVGVYFCLDISFSTQNNDCNTALKFKYVFELNGYNFAVYKPIHLQ